MNEIPTRSEDTEMNETANADPEKWERVIQSLERIIGRTEQKLKFFQNRLKQAQFMDQPSPRKVRAAEAQVDMHSVQLENLRTELHKLERLQSGGIQLHPTKINELRRIWQWINHHSTRNILYTQRVSLDIFTADWQRWIADTETYALSIETRATRILLGFMLLQCQADTVVVEFILICPDYRDRGYGSDALIEAVYYAFEELDAMHITLQVSPDNIAALTCFENVGFQYLSYTDVDVPAYTMGIDRDEWENEKPIREQETSQRLHATLQEFLN